MYELHVIASGFHSLQWCVYDTCKCADIRKCMCAAVSNYAHACAARGVILQGWMDSDPCGENTCL